MWEMKNKSYKKIMLSCGSFFIVAGFFSLFISHGKITPLYFYWFGFFLILLSVKSISKFNAYANWAIIGLLINILCEVVLTLCFSLSPSVNISYNSCIFMNWIINPIQKLSEWLFPYNQIYVHSKGVGLVVPHIRIALALFINILMYMGTIIIIAKLLSLKKRE